jgi:hypothetical protein
MRSVIEGRCLLVLLAALVFGDPAGASESLAESSTAQAGNDSTPALERRVTLTMRDTTFEAVLQEIARQARIKFIYSGVVVPLTKRVTLVVVSMAVREALRELLAGQPMATRVLPSGEIGLVFVAVDSVTDIIRGRVFKPDSTVAENALVIVTSSQTGVRRSTRAGKSGQFSLVFPSGGGEYELVVLMIGMARHQEHVSRKADSGFVMSDIYLSRPVSTLNAVSVTAMRRELLESELRARSDDSSAAQIGMGGAQALGGELGNLSSLMERIVGGYATRNGISVLGMSPSQSTVTLNGVPLVGTVLPTQLVLGSFRTTTFDAAGGGFSGGELALGFDPFSANMRRSMLSVSGNHPLLQWTDRTSARSGGQEFRQYAITATSRGPLPIGTLLYHIEGNAENRLSDAPTLIRADANALARMGLSADSVRELMRILTAQGLATSGSSYPRETVARQSFALSLENGRSTYTPGWRSFTILSGRQQGDWNFLSPRSLPSTAGRSREWSYNAQLHSVDRIGSTFLNELTVGGGVSSTTQRPAMRLPSGSVILSSPADSGAVSLANVAFGGNSAVGSRSDDLTMHIRNDLSWQSVDRKHRFKLHGEVTRSQWDRHDDSERFGTFSYTSLSALAENKPALFTRVLFAPSTKVITDAAALSFTDTWRAATRAQIVYGARIEHSRYPVSPAFNPAVDSVFGVRTDKIPRETHISPRVGFLWLYGRKPSGAPRGRLFGGIGEFRGIISPVKLANGLTHTGLAGGRQVVWCSGAAVPSPAWNEIAEDIDSIPTTCADGTVGSPFSVTQPDVMLFDPGSRAPRRYSATLGWTVLLPGLLKLTVSGEATRGTHLESATDLNFANVARFQLASEADRPVFVSPAAIDPATGAPGVGEARKSDAFAQVLNLTSDLRNRATQLSISLQPPGELAASLYLRPSFQYALTRTVVETRGTAGSTAVGPMTVNVAPGEQPIHDLRFDFKVVQITKVTPLGLASVREGGLTFRASSGAAFTPQVAGDVNGDGRFNDVPFIFSGSDSLGEAMHGLMQTGSDVSRSCLRKQAGRLAGINSCRGPWTFSLDARFTEPFLVRYRMAHLTLRAQNLLGGVDRLLHGPTDLRGWGDVPFPDPILLTVKGFDPTAQKYRYDVNRQFGEARRYAFHRPFAVELSLSLALYNANPGNNFERLLLGLDQRNDAARSFDSVVTRIRNSFVPNPAATALAFRDSLFLSDDQITRLVALAREIEPIADSVGTAMARVLLRKGKQASYDEALAEVGFKRGFIPAWDDWMSRWMPRFLEILSPEQLELVPQLATLRMQYEVAQQVRNRMQK